MLCVNFLYSTLFKWASDELCVPFFFSYFPVKTMHISVTLSVLVHMAGVFHVVALSLIRYFSLLRLSQANSNVPWLSYWRCQVIIIVIFITVGLVGVPLHFTSDVVEVHENEGCAERFPALRNHSAYQLQFSLIPQLTTFNFWIFNLLSKIIPSIILCIMTFLILDQLKKIRLLSARFSTVERDKQHQRTTKMILDYLVPITVSKQAFIELLTFKVDHDKRNVHAVKMVKYLPLHSPLFNSDSLSPTPQICIDGNGHLVMIGTLSSVMNPTNAFLISMSCCQLMLCVNFLYSTLFKWASDELCVPFFFSYFPVKTMHISVTLSVLVHMAGVFHVVALSLIRYFSLLRLSQANSNVPWLSYWRCQVIIIVIFITVGLVGVPLHFTSDVVEVHENKGCAERFPALRNHSAYQLQFSLIPQLTTFNFWIFNLLSKIIPSIILCIMTFLILDQLKKIRLLSARFSTVERDKQHQRTTKMILIIMFVFIVVEFPQGLLALAATMSDFGLIYIIGDLTELMTLLTSCIIFSLFCMMNSRIRSAIHQSPCLLFLRKWVQAVVMSRYNRSIPSDHKLLHAALSPAMIRCPFDKTQSLTAV